MRCYVLKLDMLIYYNDYRTCKLLLLSELGKVPSTLPASLRRGHSPCNSFYLVFPLVSLTYFLKLIDVYFVWFHICRLELLGEGNYGRFDKSTQEWDGMMRDLFDGVGRIFHKTTDFSPQGIVSRNSCENEFTDIAL